ncbi:MAG: hypothetical protein AAF770_02415 [Bacteroidota bacterium]
MIRFFDYSADMTSLENAQQSILAILFIAAPLSTINHLYEGNYN